MVAGNENPENEITFKDILQLTEYYFNSLSDKLYSLREERKIQSSAFKVALILASVQFGSGLIFLWITLFTSPKITVIEAFVIDLTIYAGVLSFMILVEILVLRFYIKTPGKHIVKVTRFICGQCGKDKPIFEKENAILHYLANRDHTLTDSTFEVDFSIKGYTGTKIWFTLSAFLTFIFLILWLLQQIQNYFFATATLSTLLIFLYSTSNTGYNGKNNMSVVQLTHTKKQGLSRLIVLKEYMVSKKIYSKFEGEKGRVIRVQRREGPNTTTLAGTILPGFWNVKDIKFYPETRLNKT